jgi:uncharacterized protein with HEPN domain
MRPKMPVRDWKFRIADILEAVQDSLEITRDMDYEVFRCGGGHGGPPHRP